MTNGPIPLDSTHCDEARLLNALVETHELLATLLLLQLSPDARDLARSASLRLTWCLMHSPIPSSRWDRIREYHQLLQLDLRRHPSNFLDRLRQP